MTDSNISTGLQRISNVGPVAGAIVPGTQVTKELQYDNNLRTVANTENVQGGTTDEKVSIMTNNHLQVVRDMTFANFHGMEEVGNNFTLQNVHEECNQNKEVKY